MKTRVGYVMFIWVVAFLPLETSAQSFAADFHFGNARWSEYYYLNEGKDYRHEPYRDYGIGGRLSWRFLPLVSAEADLTIYPEAFGTDFRSLSGSRFEGLFGAKFAPRSGRFRPFAKASLGFVRQSGNPDIDLSDGSQPVLAPYLSSLLEVGQTLPAYDIGGGFELSASEHGFLRLDVSERFLKYPGPAYAHDGHIREAGFGGALRYTIGFGLRF